MLYFIPFILIDLTSDPSHRCFIQHVRMTNHYGFFDHPRRTHVLDSEVIRAGSKTLKHTSTPPATRLSYTPLQIVL